MLKKLLFLAVLGGIAATVAKRLQAGSTAPDGGGWQSSYDPAPAPAAPAAPSAPITPATTAVTPEQATDVPPPPVDIPPAKTEVDPLTDPLPADDES